MSREEQEPTLDEYGAETHPAFGHIQVNRVASSHGVSLFDSEIKHQHFVVLTIRQATRKRDLNRDWIHPTEQIIEVSMSEAQWATMVSSLNSGGTPVTLSWMRKVGYLPSIPFAPRLELSIEETRRAAHRMFAKAKEALAAVKERPNKGNIRALELALNGAEPNVTYAAKTLAEHAENTVQKAKADIEAMVDSRARQLGLDPAELTLELRGPETKELEQ